MWLKYNVKTTIKIQHLKYHRDLWKTESPDSPESSLELPYSVPHPIFTQFTKDHHYSVHLLPHPCLQIFLFYSLIIIVWSHDKQKKSNFPLFCHLSFSESAVMLEGGKTEWARMWQLLSWNRIHRGWYIFKEDTKGKYLVKYCLF